MVDDGVVHPPGLAQASGGTANRTAAILLSFVGSDQPLGVTDLASMIGASKPAVHRILTSLCEQGLLEKLHGGRYRVSPVVREIGWSPRAAESLVRVGEPCIRALAEAWNETAFLSVVDGLHRISLVQQLGRQDVRLTTALGRPLPLFRGATGLAVFAFLDPSSRERVATMAGSAARAELEGQVEAIRERRYAQTHASRGGTTSAVASPVVLKRRGVVGAVTVIGSVATMQGDHLESVIEAVVVAAGAISAEIDSETRIVRPGSGSEG